MMEEVLFQELARGGRSQIQLEQEPSPVTEESPVQDENRSRVSTGHKSDVNGSPSLNTEDEDEYEKHERLELDDNEPKFEAEEFGGVDEDDKELEQEDDVQDLGEEVEEEEGDVVEEFEDDHEELEQVEHPGHEAHHAKLESVAEEEEHRAVLKERRKRKEFEIFVGGLDKDASEDDLRKAFDQVGEVTEVRLIMNPQTKKNKGFAFLHFATVEQAKRAVKELRNPVINGKQCGVTPSKDSDTLFLGNICKSWTAEALREKLKHYGVDHVDDLTLVEDTNNEGMNRGFAFLEFSSLSDALDAFKRLQKRDIFFGVDRPAKVSFADSFIDPGDEIMAQVKTVVINGLPASWDEDRVREFLKKYGAVEKIERARNMTSARRKDFGFVTFDTHEVAVTCAKSINNTELGEGDNKSKVRAHLSRPPQRDKGKQLSRGDHRSGCVQASVSRGPWIHSSACSLPSSSARNISSHVPLSGSVKRHVGLRDRRPPVMPLPSRSRAVAPLPPPRYYDRRFTQNLEKLFEQVKALNIDNARTLAGVVSQIFDKAVMEPNFCEMYANVCFYLAGELPDFVEDNEPITFKRLLLNKCQEEFERGGKEQEEAGRADAEGEIKHSPEEREEKRLNARRRTLGNIRLIGELYKKRMLTERIMHECIKELLGQYQNPDEEDLESLCKLMSTIGEMIDHPLAKDHMDAYFDRMTMLSNNMKLSSTIRFMLKDSIDLRRNKWQQRRKVEGPKKIDDVHRRPPRNFEKLFEQVKALNIDNARTLAGVVSQIFEKALMEPTFCEMYADLCYHLAIELPDFVEDNEKITFKRLLLNNCQFEFERGEEEQEEADRADAEGEIKQSSEEREEKRLNARRRMLGNIRLIGELYKKRMVIERVMHECIKKLLGQYQNPDEEDLEALCTLMSSIGEMIDHPKSKDHMDAYFDRMTMLSNNMKLSSTIRFMLKDSIDLRRNKWQQRRKIDDVHKDAAQERHSQASRLARSPSMNQSGWRTPMDFGPRGSAMLSPSSPMGGFRGLPSQPRGFGYQDARFDERQPDQPRTVPLPQRPLGDDAITLGPQGGLPRGMSGRGPPDNAGNSMLDPVESRKMMAAFNGFPNVSKRSVHNSREDHLTRYGTTDRIVVPAAYNQINAQERNMNFADKDRRNDRSFDRRIATPPPSQVQAPASTQSHTSDKELLEEFLHYKFLAAIKEYYSARDEREVALCIKELDCPSFHPSMVSFWVNDSFERKDMERDLLAKLLVNLTRSEESILTQLQLVKGFESVLTSLEDIANDAPKAAEFLGRIFGKAVSEKVVPLDEIGQLLLAGGEEPERLKEIGLAGDVIGSILETVRFEKGESLLNETKASSNLHLEDFRPKDGYRSRILEKFI